MEPIDPDYISAQYRSLLIIWSILLMSLVGFLLMTLTLRSNATGNSVITIVLIGFSLSNLSVSFTLKRPLLAKARRTQDFQFVLRAYIVALALCESSTLFGVLIHFITGSAYYYVPFGIGALGMLLHFPNKQHLLDATFKPM